jgi:hypothetical protein
MAARHWLALGMVVWAGAIAGQPPSPPPPPDAARQPQPAAEAAGTADPDDDFIEFLGADDVGDPALWVFLKKAPPRGDNPPAPPPQDAKQ